MRILYVGTIKSPILTAFLCRLPVETAKLAEGIAFTFVGDGPHLHHLEHAGWLCPGRVSRERVADYLDSADVCLLPLFSDYPETLIDASRSPTKLFEYMRAGKPMIASRWGEPLEILRHLVSGVLVDNEPHDWAWAIDWLRAHPALAAEMGAKARRVFLEKYTHEKLLGDMLVTKGGT